MKKLAMILAIVVLSSLISISSFATFYPPTGQELHREVVYYDENFEEIDEKDIEALNLHPLKNTRATFCCVPNSQKRVYHREDHLYINGNISNCEILSYTTTYCWECGAKLGEKFISRRIHSHNW